MYPGSTRTPVYPLHLCAVLDRHAVGTERGLDDVAGVRVVARQHPVAAGDDRDRAPESGKGLGQLAPDRPRPEHDEPRGPGGEGEDRLIGVVPRLCKAGDGRHGRPGTGRDHRPSESEHGVGDGYLVRAAESTMAEKDVHPELGEPPHAVHRAQIRPEFPHALHRYAEVAGDRRPSEPGGSGPRIMPCPRGRDDGFRGHAPDVQAVAPHEVPLDQRHPGPEPRGSGRGDQPRRARPYHDQVVAASGNRVDPIGGVHPGQQAGVVLVHVGDELRKLGHEVGSAVAAARARRASLVTTVVTATVAASPRPSTT